MGATTSQYPTAKTLSTPFASPHGRLVSDAQQSPTTAAREEQQRLLTLREYQMLRAARTQSHTSSSTSKLAQQEKQHQQAVTRTSSAPCLVSRSSSSTSVRSTTSSHLSPRTRTQRYTSPCVHPQFTCGNCGNTNNLIPSSPDQQAINSPSYDQMSQFCNQDCFYSYCFRLAEELDCTADDIIEGNMSASNDTMSIGEPAYSADSYQEAPQQRCMPISSRVH